MQETKTIVEIKDLSHSYGKGWAVKNVSFNINNKGITGLLGANGAGKSTTMSILCGVIQHRHGTIEINGKSILNNFKDLKSSIGFLPQRAPLYPELTVFEYLKYSAKLRGVSRPSVDENVKDAMKRCGLLHFKNRIIRNLSGGYQQRVGIAQAIVHKPTLVVFDEPTNGLDPNQILEIRNLIKEIGENHAVLISTHILSEVEAVCDDIKMIHNGELVFDGNIDAFGQLVEPSHLVVRYEAKPDLETLNGVKGIMSVESIQKNTFRIQFDQTSVSRDLIELDKKNKWRLVEIYIEKVSLESVFAKLSIN